MDIQTLLSNLHEEVSCPMCSEIFTNPKHLSCLHSFCLKCLERWYETSGGGDSVKCPTCQALSMVPPSEDLQDLPTSFHLNGLIDVITIKECNSASSQVTCGNCDKKSSDASYCFQCCMFYCQQCVTAHNIMRINTNHRVLAIKEFQDKDCEDLLKRPAFCPRQRHQKEELKYFCKDCKMAVCQTCGSLGHVGHTFTHIEDEAQRQKTELKTIFETQRQHLQALKNAVRQLDEDCTRVIQQDDEMKRNIQRFADSLIEVIEAKKQICSTAVENQTTNCLESFTTKKKEFEYEIKVIESLLEKADKLLTRGSNAEIIHLKKSIETTFEEIVQTERISGDAEPTSPPFFVENRTLLDTVSREKIGFLELLQIRPVLSFGRRGSSVATFQRPWGLAVSDRDEIAVTDCWNHRVQIFDSSGNYLRSFGRQGNKHGKFNCPYGITFHKNRNIFVADSGNHRIQIFSVEGKYIGMFGGKGIRDNQLSNPCGLSVDSNGNIIVADTGNQLIKIFSPEGTILMKIGGQGSLSFPVHCVQCGRYLIVSDHTDHCIKIYNKEGNFESKFGKQGRGDGEFDYPCFLSVNKMGHLIVCDKNNHRIQAFELNGKFFTKFGTSGNNLGEFNGPRSVAVARNGRIVVSDCGNNRIQILERERLSFPYSKDK